MFNQLLRSLRKSRRNRRSPRAARRLVAEVLEDRTLLTTDLVSVDRFGSTDGVSDSPSISADGRYVAFQSNSHYLVAGDTNGEVDVFVRNMQTETTARVSLDSNFQQGDRGSFGPSLSADGRYVAFYSAASNLVAGDTNAERDVFVRDLQTNATTRVSVDSEGNQVNGWSALPSMSGDGRRIAFVSVATNLVAGDTNGVEDVFVRDLQTNATTRVTVDSNGKEANASAGYVLSISADGRYVAFASEANNLVAGDTNAVADVFVRDLQAGITTRVSLDSNGREADRRSWHPSISGDGRYVAFASDAALVADDTNGIWDVYVRDLQDNTTTRVSLNSRGEEGQWHSEAPSISADGRYVAFQSYSKLAYDNNSSADVYLRDLLTGTTTRLSLGDGVNNVRNSTLSADGRFAAYSLGNPSGAWSRPEVDVFRIQRTQTVTAVTTDSSRSLYGQRLTFTAAVTSNGLPVAEGAVTFQENGVAWGQPVPLDFRGQASLSLSTLSATASPHAMTAEFSGTAQFIPSSATATQEVGRAPLTVVADDQIKVFDGQPFTGFTARYTGFVNDEDAGTAGISGSPSFGGPAATAVEPGTYTIVPAVGTLTAGNYEFTTFVNGTLTILPVDFGDAPDSYRTLLAGNGARHVLGSGLQLGLAADADADGQPGVEAVADAGDDGVTFTSVLRQGQTATVRVIASQPGGKLDAFLDFNADGDFSDPGEKILESVPLTAGDNELSFAVPAGAESAASYARFRISSLGRLSFDGPADDGEVEDYRVAIGLTAASEIRTDGRYQLDAYNVTPGGVVVFCYGTQPGPNPLSTYGVTLGLLDPVYVAQGIADPTGHARALLTVPPALVAQPLFFQVFEQGPNPQAGSVRPLTAAALSVMPTSGAGEASGEFPPAVVARAAGGPRRDVNRDGRVTPLDVLLLINFLNQQASDRTRLDAAVSPPPSYDVDGDSAVSPQDALSVINDLNALPAPGAEGEGVQSGRVAALVPKTALPSASQPGLESSSIGFSAPLPSAIRRAVTPAAADTTGGLPADFRSTLSRATSREPALLEAALEAILPELVTEHLLGRENH